MARRKSKTVEKVAVIKPTVKQALIQNITFGDLCNKEFSLRTNEVKTVVYTQRIKDYAGKKLIKILKIY